MIETAPFLVFLGGALLLNITPGPDVAFTLASTARGGARSGIAAAVGIGAGSLGWTIATAAGLAALLAASEHMLTIIRIVGGFYLLYLAIKVIVEKTEFQDPAGVTDMVQSFRAGALTNLFNPKVGLFFVAFLPGFARPEAGPVALQILILGAIFSITGVCVLIAVAFFAGALRRKLAQSQRMNRGFKALSASVFGGLGFYLLLPGNR